MGIGELLVVLVVVLVVFGPGRLPEVMGSRHDRATGAVTARDRSGYPLCVSYFPTFYSAMGRSRRLPLWVVAGAFVGARPASAHERFIKHRAKEGLGLGPDPWHGVLLVTVAVAVVVGVGAWIAVRMWRRGKR